MTALFALCALILPPVLAMQGKAYGGAYGAVALLSFLLGFFVASPWPTSGSGLTENGASVGQFMNEQGGNFGVVLMALAIGGILAAMLYRAPKVTQDAPRAQL